MADGRSRDEWGRMSSLLALVANVNRDPKKRSKPFTPADFSPHAGRRRRPVSVDRLANDMVKFAESRAKKGK